MDETVSSVDKSAIRDSRVASLFIGVEAAVVLVIISVTDRSSSGFGFKDVGQSAFVLNGGLFVPLLKIP